MSSGIEKCNRVTELLVLVLMSSAHTTTLSNPCFLDYSSQTCLGHIAKLRAITNASAAQLRTHALQLFEHERSSPSAVYDAQTVAVACLASAGTLKPGPDSDCAACGPACTQESRQEVCYLYCDLYAINKATIAVIKLELMPGFGTTLNNLNKTLKIEALHTKTTESMRAIYLFIIHVNLAVIGASILIVVFTTLLILLWIKKRRNLCTDKGMRM